MSRKQIKSSLINQYLHEKLTNKKAPVVSDPSSINSVPRLNDGLQRLQTKFRYQLQELVAFFETDHGEEGNETQLNLLNTAANGVLAKIRRYEQRLKELGSFVDQLNIGTSVPHIDGVYYFGKAEGLPLCVEGLVRQRETEKDETKKKNFSQLIDASYFFPVIPNPISVSNENDDDQEVFSLSELETSLLNCIKQC
ncbi:hypothetical protein PCE1_003524 [Barthelona sp. PCE]